MKVTDSLPAVFLDRALTVAELGATPLGQAAKKGGLRPEELSRSFSGERPIRLDKAAVFAHANGLNLDRIVLACRTCGSPTAHRDLAA